MADGSAQTTGQSVAQIAAVGDINVESWDKVAETLKFDPQEYRPERIGVGKVRQPKRINQ